jgi:hypothetical protein
MKTDRDAVLENGEKVYAGRKVFVGLAGHNEVEYGFLLMDDLENGADLRFGCDLFFRKDAYSEGDVLGYVWLDESDYEDGAQFDNAQDAVDYAMESLTAHMQELADTGSLSIDHNGNCLTIYKSQEDDED